MEARISVLILATTTIVNCLPPPHPEVVAVRQAEALLPPHLKSPALRNPHLLHTLELTSLLHSGEKLVYDREADHVPRREIYDILAHAGFIGRKKHINQSPPKDLNHAKTYHQSYDSSFIFDSDIAQYL